MSTIVKCRECFYCDKIFTTDYDQMYTIFEGGTCLRYPPVYIGIGEDGEEIWGQPFMKNDDSCGEGVYEN